MSEKAITIGLYAVASGIFTAFLPSPRVAGSRVVRKYLEKDIERETGGRFLFTNDIEEAARGIVAHLDTKRKALNLAPMLYQDGVRSRTAWRPAASPPTFRRPGWRRSDAGRPRNTARRGLRRNDVRPVLIFNRDRCLACLSCELACSLAHSGRA